MSYDIVRIKLDAAKLRLSHFAASRASGEITELYIDILDKYKPNPLPDAYYVEPVDKSDKTLLYDVRQGRFVTMVWTDWRDAREDERFEELYESLFE